MLYTTIAKFSTKRVNLSLREEKTINDASQSYAIYQGRRLYTGYRYDDIDKAKHVYLDAVAKAFLNGR